MTSEKIAELREALRKAKEALDDPRAYTPELCVEIEALLKGEAE